MKRITPSLLIFLVFIFPSKAQLIQPGIYGQNANFTNTVGINLNTGGLLENYWQTAGTFSGQNYVKQSNVQYMRYDGIFQEENCQIDGSLSTPTSGISLTRDDYVRKAIAMQDNGITLMLLMPLRLVNPITTVTIAAQQAASLVAAVNNSLTATPKPGGGFYSAVTHWIYSNEPEKGNNHNFNGSNAAQLIHDYIKAYHTEVMAIWSYTAWGTPKFIGPELESYDTYLHTTGADQLIQQLVGVSNSYGTTYSFTPYIDVFSWHCYPFNDESTYAGDIPAPTRSNVINYLATGAPSGDNSFTTTPLINNINQIKSWLASTGNSSIEIAITEANICGKNNVANTYTGAGATDDLVTGNGANSFIAGQFLAEMTSICMNGGLNYLNMWSAIEGTSLTAYSTDIGYLNSNPGKPGGVGARKSTYHHFKMMADNFKGTFYPSTGINVISAGTPTNVKAFAAISGDKIAVMILNQQLSTDPSLPFQVRLNGGSAPISGLDLAFNIAGAAGGSGYTSTSTSTGNISGESTVLLIFNCKGAFVERWDYKRQDAAIPQGPQKTETGSVTLIAGGTTISFATPPVVANSTGQISLTPGAPTFTYTWFSLCGPVPISNFGATATITACNGLNNSVYTFTATDSQGCYTSQNINFNGTIVTGNGGTVAKILGIKSSTCGASNGSATVTVSWNGPPGTFSTSWDGGAYVNGGNSPVGLAPGSHTVKTIINSGYPQTLYFYIPIQPGTQPAVNAGPDQVVNANCIATVTAYPNLSGSGYSYQWFNNNSSSISSSYSLALSVWGTNALKVKVYNSAGCYNTDNVTVTAKYPRCRPSYPEVTSGVPCPETQTAKSSGSQMEVINSALTINSNQFIDKIYKVTNSGVLIIKDCELAMAAGSKIIVQPGGQLIIENSYLHGCGGYYIWEGIEVKGNNNDPDQLHITGSVLANANTLIKTDKTVGIYLNDNTFYNGTTAIDLDRNKDFTITKNDFYNFTTGLNTTRTTISDVRSLIKENLFEDTKTAIAFSGDNHGKLDILCNVFNKYADYAIYSDNSTLKDQGATISGAANTFSSTSIKLNHQFRHNGNTLNYYFDPSYPLTLSTGAGLMANAQVAGADGSCVQVLNTKTAGNANAETGTVKSFFNSGNADEIEFKAFPNPFNDQLTILYSLPKNCRTGTLEIYEAASGKEIYTANLIEGQNKIEINKINIIPGIYICSIVSADGISKQFKLVSIK